MWISMSVCGKLWEVLCGFDDVLLSLKKYRRLAAAKRSATELLHYSPVDSAEKDEHNPRTCWNPPAPPARHTACGAVFVWALMYYLQSDLSMYLIAPWSKHTHSLTQDFFSFFLPFFVLPLQTDGRHLQFLRWNQRSFLTSNFQCEPYNEGIRDNILCSVSKTVLQRGKKQSGHCKWHPL